MKPEADGLTVSKARIKWLCRRGMKELDVLLERFFTAEFDGLSDSEQSAFHTLVQCEDPEIYYFLLGRTQPDDPAVAALVTRIQAYQAVTPG